MRPGPQRRAEGAADEGRDDTDALLRYAEDMGDLLAVIVHPLRLVVEGEVLALPMRDRHMRLNRVVVLARMHIGGVHPHRRPGEGAIRIAAAGVAGAAGLGI